MNTPHSLLRSTSFKKFFQQVIMVLSALLPMSASAVFIDFNDLNPVYDEEWPCWCDNELSDQYLDKGLLIHGSWVNGAGGQNVMTTSNFGSLEFIGSLPVFVSMDVYSVYGDATVFNVYGLSGHLFTYITPWPDYESEKPEFVTLTATEGIQFITIEGWYGMRMGAQIDNLTYTYAAVPEPAPALLISLGLFFMAYRRLIRRPGQ